MLETLSGQRFGAVLHCDRVVFVEAAREGGGWGIASVFCWHIKRSRGGLVLSFVVVERF